MNTERHPVEGTDYYVRELGYLEFVEITRRTKADDEEERGLEIIKAVMLACVEDAEGNPALDAQSIRRLKRAVFEPLSKAAMKAQGHDMDAKAEPLTPEQAEGNA